MKDKLKLFFGKQIYRLVHFDTHDYRNAVFLSGSARSGTTWLQEIVNYDNEYRVLFEPFRPEKVEIVNHWDKYQYIRSEDNSPRFLNPMNDILSGKIRNVWIDTYNQRLFSANRMIKAIYANLFLSWVKKQFPEVPIILILRHPCAVANSKMNIVEKHFRFDQNPLDVFLSQEHLMEDFLHPYENELHDNKTVFETFIYMWCIEYLIPLKQFMDEEICITFYENLCINPQQEIKNIFSYLNKPFSQNVIHKTNIPSQVSRNNSAINSGENLIRNWRKNITGDQIHKAIGILKSFGLDIIYNDGDLPVLNSSEIISQL